MRKITLSAEEHSINDLPDTDRLVYDANGFPAASNFTKKSKGATLKHLNQSRTLVVRNNKLCWKKNTRSMKGGAYHNKKSKKSKKKSRSRSRSREISSKSNSNNLLKMMMMQQMLTRGRPQVTNQDEDHYMIQKGAGDDVVAVVNNESSFKESLRRYQDHLESIRDLSWDQLNSAELEEIVEIQDYLKNVSQMLTKITQAFVINLKEDVLNQSTRIKNQVKSNNYGENYNNQLKSERVKIKQFLAKYSNLNNLCQINNDKFEASAEFCKLYSDTNKLSKEIDQLSVQNDFNKNLSELKNFLNNNITLSPEEVTSKVDENNSLINQYPAEFLGASLIDQFKTIYKQIVDKETERGRQERLRQDAERAKITSQQQPEEAEYLSITTTTATIDKPEISPIYPNDQILPQSTLQITPPTTSQVTTPPAEPKGILATIFGATNNPFKVEDPAKKVTLEEIEERLTKLEQQQYPKQKRPEDLYQLDPNAISPQQPNYY